MTLFDVCKLIQHYAKQFVVIVVVCTLVGFSAGFLKVKLGEEEYTSTAVLTVSEPTGIVSADEMVPLVQAVATNVLAEDAYEGVVVDAKSDSVAHTITFSVTSSTEDGSIELANRAATRTVELVKEILSAMSVRYVDATPDPAVASNGFVPEVASSASRAAALQSVAFAMNDASDASSKSGNKGICKFVVAGLLAGLFLGVCAVLLINLIKAPIRGRREVEEAFELPVLMDGSVNEPGERFWANLVFSADRPIRSVCLIPVSTGDIVTVDGDLFPVIDKSEDNVSVITCKPIAESAGTLYSARKADAVVLVASKWKDSMELLAEAVRELELIRANPLGIVLIEA